MKGFLIYDFEVFKHDWHVSFIDSQTKEIVHITNDRERLINFINMVGKEYVLVGYNNKSYDNNILRATLIGINPWDMNDWIITQGKQPFHYPGFRDAYNIKLATYDLKNGVTGVVNAGLSLKEYQAYKGLDIVETSVDFNIDRKLTQEEMEQTIKYCDNDVLSTLMMFEEPSQQKGLGVRLDLIREFNLPLVKWLHQTDANIAAEILGAVKYNIEDGHIYEFPSNLQIENQEVKDFFSQPLTSKMKLKLPLFGMDLIFGIGGLHGAIKNYQSNGVELILSDANSYFPSLILVNNLLSRGVVDKNKYEEIYKKRFILKKEGKSEEQLYKLILNIVYGAMDGSFNKLYDTKMRRAVAINSQLYLLDLMEKLEPYVFFVQVNTDGILYSVNEGQQDKVDEIMKEWEDRTNIGMGHDVFIDFHQSDVNNYIGVMEGGKIKTKGAAVKFSTGASPYKHNLNIIQQAVKNYLIDGISIEETIKNGKNIQDYQMIVKKTGKYAGIYQFKGDLRVDLQKVNRIFPTRKQHLSQVFKWRLKDNGETQVSKYTNTPNNVFVWNKDINELTFDMIDLDYDYYIKEATKISKRYMQK